MDEFIIKWQRMLSRFSLTAPCDAALDMEKLRDTIESDCQNQPAGVVSGETQYDLLDNIGGLADELRELHDRIEELIGEASVFIDQFETDINEEQS